VAGIEMLQGFGEKMWDAGCGMAGGLGYWATRLLGY